MATVKSLCGLVDFIEPTNNTFATSGSVILAFTTGAPFEQKAEVVIPDWIYLKPLEIYVNNGTTICKFLDGDTVTSKPKDGEEFDIEVGVAMCVMKKLFGGRGKWLQSLEKAKFQEKKVKK